MAPAPVIASVFPPPAATIRLAAYPAAGDRGVWKILTHLQQRLDLPEVSLPNYTIKSAREAAERVERPKNG